MSNLKKCCYVFPNNSKKHEQGEICGNIIRLKKYEFCWRHRNLNTPSYNEIKSHDNLEKSENGDNRDYSHNRRDIVDTKSNFIQLENTPSTKKISSKTHKKNSKYHS